MRPWSRSAVAVALAFALCACAAPPSGLEVEVDGELVRVRCGGQPFATVHAAASPRPYVWPLLAPGQVPVTRDFPMGERADEQHDHPHHQSLWLAHGAVAGFDFWHGSGRGERQELVGLHAAVEGAAAVVTCSYEWRVDDGVLLREARTLRFGAAANRRTLEVRSELQAVDGPVRFGDTKEGTFALRVHPQLRVEGPVANGSLRNADGQRDGAVWGKRSRWICDSGRVDGRPVAIAMFDHPDNLRHPTWWHARTYGLLAANPFGAHDFDGSAAGTGDLELVPGQPLQLRWQVVLFAGQPDDAIVDAAWEAWTEVRERTGRRAR